MCVYGVCTLYTSNECVRIKAKFNVFAHKFCEK